MARGVLAKEIDALEGCRWIAGHRTGLTHEERDDPEQDLERASYVQRNEPYLIEACKAVVAKYS